MRSFHWLKLWIEVLDDHKMGMLPDHLWRRVIESFLLAKSTGSDNGALPTLNASAWRLRVSPQELENDWKEIAETTGILQHSAGGWHVTNFEKRQSRMTDAERQERKRERDRLSNGAVTVCDTEQSRAEADKSRAEQNAAAAALSIVTDVELDRLCRTYGYTVSEVEALAASIKARKNVKRPAGLLVQCMKDGDRAPPAKVRDYTGGDEYGGLVRT